MYLLEIWENGVAYSYNCTELIIRWQSKTIHAYYGKNGVIYKIEKLEKILIYDDKDRLIFIKK